MIDNQCALTGIRQTNLIEDGCALQAVIHALVSKPMIHAFRSEDTFKRDVCAPLLTVGNWKAFLVKKYGQTANTAAFERMVNFLSTRGGLARVRHCMASGTPLHGKSANDKGIEATCLNLMMP